MKVLNIRTIKGPNYWSVQDHRLIVMTLDLEEYAKIQSNEIDGFQDRLSALLFENPSQNIPEEVKTEFLAKTKEGTSIAHVIERLALAIQIQAEADVEFGITNYDEASGFYEVVFAYSSEMAGRFAAKSAFRITAALISGQAYDFPKEVQFLKSTREKEEPTPSTNSVIQEAIKRNIPWVRLHPGAPCQLGYGANQKWVLGAVTCETSCLGVEMSGNKQDTKQILSMAQVPVPYGHIVSTEEELERAIADIGFPVVLKPINANQGRGITTNIENVEDAKIALATAQKISRSVIIEQYIIGDDYRFLVVDYKLVAVSLRTPAHVIGNGKNTIQQLIDEVNKDPLRGEANEKVLLKIRIDANTEAILKSNGYTLETVLLDGETLYLKDTANLHTGGTAADVTDLAHPSIIKMVERVAKLIRLDICGVDVLTSDISRPLSETRGGILEVNASPGLGMHIQPTSGLARNVGGAIVEMLFPEGASGRIPVVAVTGTDDTTTLTQLIAHMATKKGFKTGYNSTKGVFINNSQIIPGNRTESASAQFVLCDPTVEFAILECAHEGILQSGLSFDHCEIGIVTSINAGEKSTDQLVRLKSLVPKTVLPEGYAILNADDSSVYKMRRGLDCNVALFTMNPDNPRVKVHAKYGGLSAIYEEGFISICQGEWKTKVVEVAKIPSIGKNASSSLIQNVLLPSVLNGYINGFTFEFIETSLNSFAFQEQVIAEIE